MTAKVFLRHVLAGAGGLALSLHGGPDPAAAETLLNLTHANGDNYRLVTSSGYSGEVLFLDVQSLAVRNVIKIGGHPDEVMVTSGDGCVYVTDRERSLIRVLDPTNAHILGTVSLPGTGLPHLAVSKDGEVLYVADEATGSVFRVQPTRGVYQVGSPLLPGSHFESIALSGDGNRLLLADNGHARIVVLNTDPFAPLADIPVDGGSAMRIRVAPEDEFALVSDELPGEVSVLDLSHLEFSTRIPLEPGVSDMAIAPDGASAYVSVWTTHAIFQINLKTWKWRQMTSVPFSPGALAISPDSRYLAVTERLTTLEHMVHRIRPVGVVLIGTDTHDIVHSAELLGDPHAVRFVKIRPPDSHQESACPRFRHGQWTKITVKGVPRG